MMNETVQNKEWNNNHIKLLQLPIKGSVIIPERLAELNANQSSAVLATSSDNNPYTSLVAFVLTPDFKGALFATPRNTLKYRNIIKFPNVALLIDNRSNTNQDIIDAEAITLIGRAKILRKGKRQDELMKIFLKKHPALEEFVKAKTTALIYVSAARYIHVSKFQSVTVWELQS